VVFSFPISIAAKLAAGEKSDVTKFSTPGNHSSRRRQRFRSGPWVFEGPFGLTYPRHCPHHRTGESGRFDLGFGGWPGMGDQAPGGLPAKILLRYLPGSARSRSASGCPVCARKVVRATLG